jgi:hypothetical protein
MFRKYQCPYFIIGILVVFAALWSEYATGTFSTPYAYWTGPYDGVTQGEIIWVELEDMARSSQDKLNLVYSYSVDGVTYENDRVNFLSKTAYSQELAKVYSVGEYVQVFYDQESPEKSVLQNDGLGMWFVGQIFAILLFMAILLLALCRER